VKALVWHGDRRLVLEQLPDPAAGADEVVFEVSLAGICGSDLHPYRGDAGPRRPPLVLGHEAVGTLERGDGRFAVFPLSGCGACPACRRGDENLCERRVLLGLNRQGVFQERLAVAERELVALPQGLGDKAACLVEPLATALAALEEGQEIPEALYEPIAERLRAVRSVRGGV
jgi:threonine dehydrogenase-like Zn-dependent dehydrogenase